MITGIVAPFEYFSSVEWSAGAAGAAVIFQMFRPYLSADGAGLPSLGRGIAKFKFIRSPRTAERIVQGWNATRRSLAKRDLRVDLPIVVASAVGFAIIVSSTIAAVIDNSWLWVGTVTRVVAWMPLVAGCCGLAENWFLWRRIRRFQTTPPTPQTSTPRIAKWFAISKISLFGMCAAWLTLVAVPLLVAP